MSLTSINIPNTVTTLGDYALSWNRISTVTISRYVTNMGINPFAGNSTLTTITVAGDNPSYKSVNNAIYTKDGTTLITGTKQMSNNIPNTTIVIAQEAFSGMGLTSVTVPNSVTTIGDWAFYYNNIKQGNAKIDNVRGNVSIGYGAFHNNGSDGYTTITPIYLRS